MLSFPLSSLFTSTSFLALAAFGTVITIAEFWRTATTWIPAKKGTYALEVIDSVGSINYSPKFEVVAAYGSSILGKSRDKSFVIHVTHVENTNHCFWFNKSSYSLCSHETKH